MKTIVTISRKWDNPQIETTVWKKGEDQEGRYVEIKCSLPDFIESLKKDIGLDIVTQSIIDSIGSVTMVFTKAEIEKRIRAALDTVALDKKIDIAVSNVLAAMKEEWVKHPD
jgi:hypothetical protein